MTEEQKNILKDNTYFDQTGKQILVGAVSSSNCEKCAYFIYEASWGYGWCYNDNSQYSGKLRGNGPSCNLDSSKR